MLKPSDPRQLALDIMGRSICSVQVGCAIADGHGICGWGWNSVGNGFGIHAEIHALRRTSRKRIEYATLYVASQRMRNRKPVMSRPCEEVCTPIIKKMGIRTVWYRNGDGIWIREEWL